MILLDRLKELQPALLEKWIFALLIVLLPTQLGKHFWPSWSFVFSLKIDYLAITIYLWDLLVVFLLILFIWQKRRINKTAGMILLIFLISQCVSLFFSSNWYVGVSRLINWLPAGLFGLYIASIPADKTRQIVLGFLPIALVGSAILAIIQVLIGSSVGLWVLGERSFSLATSGIATFNWYGQIFLRPYSTFSHPNVFAAFMLLCGVLLFNLKMKPAPLLILNQLLIPLVVLLSFSRASLAVLMMIGLFILRKQLLLIVLLFLVFSPLIFVRFDSAFNFDQLSLIRREELAETALKMSYESPLVGVGLNNFIPTAMSSVFLSGTNRFLQPVHNIFLLVLAESGIIGLAGLILLLISSLFLYSHSSLLRRSQIVGLLLVVVFLGMVDHYFLTLPQGQRLLFLLWGVFLSRKSANLLQ